MFFFRTKNIFDFSWESVLLVFLRFLGRDYRIKVGLVQWDIKTVCYNCLQGSLTENTGSCVIFSRDILLGQMYFLARRVG